MRPNPFNRIPQTLQRSATEIPVVEKAWSDGNVDVSEVARWDSLVSPKSGLNMKSSNRGNVAELFNTNPHDNRKDIDMEKNIGISPVEPEKRLSTQAPRRPLSRAPNTRDMLTTFHNPYEDDDEDSDVKSSSSTETTREIHENQSANDGGALFRGSSDGEVTPSGKQWDLPTLPTPSSPSPTQTKSPLRVTSASVSFHRTSPKTSTSGAGTGAGTGAGISSPPTCTGSASPTRAGGRSLATSRERTKMAVSSERRTGVTMGTRGLARGGADRKSVV